MKNLFILLLSVLFFACDMNAKKAEDKETIETSGTTTYGEEVNSGSSITVSEMLTKLEEKDSVYVTVKGEITSTCKMKGCWMNISLPKGEEMRVTFKDYGFFVPKEGMEGKTATFEGWVKKSTVDEETRRHFAKDAGKSEEEINAITGDEEQLAFVAEGVEIQ